jgi:DNA-directed RNA polymerase subunit RPC12/RpoP
MAARAGEKAPETGDYYCENCAKRIHVTKDDAIPCCPICGHNSFGEDPKELKNPGSG